MAGSYEAVQVGNARPVYTSTDEKSQVVMPETVREHANSQSSSLSNAKTEDDAYYKSQHLEKLQTIRHRLGLEANGPVEEHLLVNHDAQSELWWPHIRAALREPLGEFFGTFIMIMFGDGSVAQVLLSTNDTHAPGGHGYGNYQSISWGWGLGVMLGIYVAGDSGGFLNPAITFANCLFRGLPWRRFPIYLLAQFLGAFTAAAVVYANYEQAIDQYEGGKGLRTVPPAPNATAGIFCTYPQAYLTKGGQFVSEFITSSLLIFVIYALKDDFNPGAQGRNTTSGHMFPLAIFFLIFGLGACFGVETGYAINLARDLGPRVMSWCLGYGREVFSAGDYYFWVAPVASFVGCTFGAMLYDIFLYTGPESPMNQEWFGLKKLLQKEKKQPQTASREAV